MSNSNPEQSQSSNSNQAQSQNFLLRMPLYLQIITGLAAVGGIIWAVIKFFLPFGEVDLTVWIRQEIPIRLPELLALSKEAALSLRLTYNEKLITHATVLTVNISNTGSKLIGTDENRWDLTLRTADESTLLLIGGLEPKPENLKVKATSSPSADRLTLQLGLFNRDDSIDLRLLILEPKDSTRPARYPIIAETRLPNLSAPTVTTSTLLERLRDAFFLPLWITAFVVLMIGLRDPSKGGWSAIKEGSPLKIVGGLVGALIVLIWGSGLIAFGLSWVLSWGVFLASKMGP